MNIVNFCNDPKYKDTSWMSKEVREFFIIASQYVITSGKGNIDIALSILDRMKSNIVWVATDKIMKPNFSNIIENCQNDDWVKKQLIGKGKGGSVYVACRTDKESHCNYVMKIQKYGKDFLQEVTALKDLQGWIHAPVFYGAWSCNGKGYFIMERLEKCKPEWGTIKLILDELHDRDWVHVDTHKGNIMCRPNTGEFVLIDYGWSVKFPGKRGKDKNSAVARKWKKSLTFEDMKILEKHNLLNDFDMPDTERIQYIQNFDDLVKRLKINIK